jgi:hypothetical protein
MIEGKSKHIFSPDLTFIFQWNESKIAMHWSDYSELVLSCVHDEFQKSLIFISSDLNFNFKLNYETHMK